MKFILFIYCSLSSEGELITLPLQRYSRKSVLTYGCVSADFPRSIYRIEGSRNVNQYLTVLEKVGEVGRTIVHNRSPVHSSPIVKDFIAARDMASILWPTLSGDIMPMTSIWRNFITEFNYANPIVGNFNELWFEIEEQWNKFVENEFYVRSATVGYLWLNLSNIADQYNSL